MPYAKEQTLSKAPIEGGIPITDEQYKQAVQDKLDGKVVVAVGSGLQTFDSPRRAVYSTTDGSKTEIAAWGETPTGFTDSERPDQWHKWDGAAWVKDEEAELNNWRDAAVVSRFQALQALDDFGLLAAVEDWAAGQTGKARRAFDMAQEFRYRSPTLDAACEALGVTDAQRDDLFTYGMTIEA